MSFTNDIGNTKVLKAYNESYADRVGKVNKRANETIKSFADLVGEINRLQNDAAGTPKRKEVEAIANDLNNSNVMLTRMLAANIEALNGIIQEQNVAIESKEVSVEGKVAPPPIG